MSTSEVPCGLCKKVLSSKEDAKHHLIEVHQVSPAAFDSLPSSDNNNNTSGGGGAGGALPPQFMPVVMNPLQLTSLIQAHAAVVAGGGVPVFPAHPAFSHMQQKLAYLASPRAPIPPTLLASMAVGVKKEPGTSAITTAAAAAANNSNTATSTTKTASSVNSSGEWMAEGGVFVFWSNAFCLNDCVCVCVCMRGYLYCVCVWMGVQIFHR